MSTGSASAPKRMKYDIYDLRHKYFDVIEPALRKFSVDVKVNAKEAQEKLIDVIKEVTDNAEYLGEKTELLYIIRDEDKANDSFFNDVEPRIVLEMFTCDPNADPEPYVTLGLEVIAGSWNGSLLSDLADNAQHQEILKWVSDVSIFFDNLCRADRTNVQDIGQRIKNGIDNFIKVVEAVGIPSQNKRSYHDDDIVRKTEIKERAIGMECVCHWAYQLFAAFAEHRSLVLGKKCRTCMAANVNE